MDETPRSRTAANPFQWLPDLWESNRKRVRPQARLLALSLVVGIVAGLAAIAFYSACQLVSHYALGFAAGYHPTKPGGEKPLLAESDTPLRPWVLLLMPALGGLLSGLIVYKFAPEAEGHGTDAAIAAYHYHQGQIRARVPLVKLAASAFTLGFGGSGGREGPIAQIGAGCGSFLGSLLRLRPAERRVLMAAGMGAGIAAIFRAPVAGALFASEVLYSSSDFESEVVMPACLASVTAYSTLGLAFGWKPLFTMTPAALEALQFASPLELLPYLLLAIFMVVLATIFVRSFYWLTDLCHQIPVRDAFRPALGALASGLLAVVLYFAFGRSEEVLAVLSFGYGILQDALSVPPDTSQSLFAAALLLAVALGKIVTTGLTIGSGGSAGVFGPSMVIGGCGGGALGIALHWLDNRLVPHQASFVIVGMAGFFAAAGKTPFSTLVMVSEITGSYGLLLPTLWVCSLCFILSDTRSIYSSQVEKRSLSPAHQGDYVREVLGDLRVRQFIGSPTFPTLQPEDSLAKVMSRLAAESYPVLPVINADGRLLGVVSLEEVHLASQSPHIQSLVIAEDLMRSDIIPLRPDDRLDQALEMFVDSGLMVLPVVDGTPEQRVVGLVNRSDLSRLYLRSVQGATARSDEPAQLL